MILNVPNPQLIRANREDLPTTGEFTYKGNTVRHDGGANKDIKNRLVNAIYGSQNAQLCMEVPAAEHQDQAKTIL